VTVSAGHCHPEVNKAVNEQNAKLQHTTTIYHLNEQRSPSTAREPAAKMPGNPKVCMPLANMQR
jgi:alanine-glyoxylate transaminase/(R)-3-amino-2-methylpropionate-pyruvate transaminase